MTRSIPTLVGGIFIGILSTIGVATATNHVGQANRLVTEARAELAEIQSMIPAAYRNPSVLRRIEAESNELSRTLASLDRTVDNMRAPTAPRVVSSSELTQIERSIDRESFSDDQLAVLRSASRGRHFTSSQVIRLMNGFSFDDDKVEAAVILFPRVIDQQNWYTVYGGLTFSSDKTALRRRTM